MNRAPAAAFLPEKRHSCRFRPARERAFAEAARRRFPCAPFGASRVPASQSENYASGRNASKRNRDGGVRDE